MRSIDALKRRLLEFLARRFPPPPVPLNDYEVEDGGAAMIDDDAQNEEGISAITVVMNRREFLLRALPTWLKHEEIKEIVILDWSSKVPVSEALRQFNDPRIRIIRVNDQPLFVLTWAYNLAARYARFSTLLKIDSDVLLSPDFFALHRLGDNEFISGHFSRVGRGLGGLLLIRRADYFAVNGFNEHMTSYGWDDNDLYARLVRAGRSQRFFVRASCTHIPHSDRLRLIHKKVGVPIRKLSIIHNELTYSGSDLWSRVRNMLEVSEASKHRTVICRYREMKPEDYLHDLRGGKVDYFRVSGNWGDSLIAAAGRQLLSKEGVRFNEYLRTAPEQSKRSDIAIIKGGGGLIDLYHLNRDFLHSIVGKYSRIILLPMTMAGEKQKELLQRLDDTVTIFCREKQSFDFIKHHWVHANGQLFLAHDLALDFDYLPYRNTSGEGLLNAFRTDSERTDRALPADNVDISQEGNVSTPIDRFLQIIAGRREVHTNRLHVAIAAACLGKEVNLYANSYGKNRAVYEYSLRRFSNVRWGV